MRLKFIADQNFDNNILRGLLRQHPDLDIMRVQDVGLSEAKDPVILEWAAAEERVLLTHDIRTMPDYAYQRLANGLPMPGIIVVNLQAATGRVIEEILLLAEFEEECFGQVQYLPLK